MTPPLPDDRPRVRSTPPRAAYRTELTRQVVAANRVFDIDADLPEDAKSLQKASRSGAQWFYWIAGFSLVNTTIALFGGNSTFLMGLAVSLVVDVLARHLGSFGPYLGLGLNAVIAFFFCGFGYLAAGGSRAAYLVGMILYALDGLLCLYLKLYLPAGFHAFVLLMVSAGYHSQRKLARPPDDLAPPKLTAA